jgi:hypothetical protein
VPDKTFEVAEGGLYDGHPFFFFYGNPTRSPGKFYRVCFGNEQEGWVNKAIDSRDCSLPNKELLGVDRDLRPRQRFRPRPPASGRRAPVHRTAARIKEAQEREPQSLDDDPLICGVDVSGGGCLERRGIPPRR